MGRKKQAFVVNLLIFGLCFVVASFSVALITPVSFNTADDSKIYFDLLQKDQQTEVLGASTEIVGEEALNLCPPNQPIIGWIDYKGNKTIVTKLSKNLKASSCFVDLKEANSQGYNLEN